MPRRAGRRENEAKNVITRSRRGRGDISRADGSFPPDEERATEWRRGRDKEARAALKLSCCFIGRAAWANDLFVGGRLTHIARRQRRSLPTGVHMGFDRSDTSRARFFSVSSVSSSSTEPRIRRCPGTAAFGLRFDGPSRPAHRPSPSLVCARVSRTRVHDRLSFIEDLRRLLQIFLASVRISSDCAHRPPPDIPDRTGNAPM